MATQTTTNCRTCRGTSWHNNALCYACELTSQQAASVACERARTGLSTPTEALAAFDRFEANQPICYEPRDIADADTKQALEEYQRAVLARAPKLGAAA